MHGAQIAERLVFAEHLHERGEHQVRGARRVGVAEHDFALVDGIREVLPALGDRQLLARHHLAVVTERDDAPVYAGHAALRDVADALRPFVELRDVGGPVFREQPFLGGLQVRVGRSGPPDVALRIGGLGLHLREHLAGRLLHDGHTRAGRLLEADGHALAPGSVGRAAVQVEMPLRPRAERHEQQHGGDAANDRH